MPASVAIAVNETLAGGDLSSYFADSYNMVGTLLLPLLHFVYTSYIPEISKCPMSKEKVINFRIDAQLKKQAKKIAEADGRSLSNWLTRLIEKEVAQASKR